MHKLTNEVLAVAERVYERIKKAERQYQLTENTTWPLRYYEYNADIEDEKDYKILEKLFYDAFNNNEFIDKEYMRHYLGIFLEYLDGPAGNYETDPNGIKRAIDDLRNKKDFISLIDLICILIIWTEK